MDDEMKPLPLPEGSEETKTGNKTVKELLEEDGETDE